MRKLCGPVVVLLAGSVLQAVGADNAALKKDMPYAQARLALLSAGWSPAPQEPAQFAEQRCGARVKICGAYPETEACSGTGMGFCAFRFRNARGNILAITTTGEELADLTVYSWRNE
jgi:hypothetical protein